MAIIDLFSSRMKKKKVAQNDVYQYDDLPVKLRAQIVHIIRESIGLDGEYNQYPAAVYQKIYSLLCKEFGLFELAKNSKSRFESIYNYFLHSNDIEQCMDIIELTFRIINSNVRDNLWHFSRSEGWIQDPDSAIEELNHRFREANVGYQFIANEIIRVDSQFIHAEIVKPTFNLLGFDKKYQGANDEFLSAHTHYRHARYKEATNECLKSFESLIKGICEKRGWKFSKSDNAKNLINICFEKDLFPSYMQTQFASLRNLLETGVPTIRNKAGAHGQGSEIVEIPEHLASYMIHLTATNLIFLANCEKNLQ